MAHRINKVGRVYFILTDTDQKVEQHCDYDVAQARLAELNQAPPPVKKADEIKQNDSPSKESFDVLKGTLADLRRALDSGSLDYDLAGLLAQERTQKHRAGAISAIESRQATLA